MQFSFSKDFLKSIGAKLLFWWFLLGGMHILTALILLTGYNYWPLGLPVSIIHSAVWGLLFLLIFCCCLLSKKHRQNNLQHLIAIIIAMLLIPPTIWASWHIRMKAFDLAGQRSEPIIEAIDKYFDKEGTPPKNLEALVPNYLNHIPTNIPKYSISKTEEGWCLRFNASTGISNYNELIYCSDENFPKRIGPSYTPLGKWIYIHDE